MLVEIKLQVFSMLSVGVPIRMHGIGMRGIVLLRSKKLLGGALLKLYHRSLTKDGGHLNKLFSSVHLSPMITAYLRDDGWLFVCDTIFHFVNLHYYLIYSKILYITLQDAQRS